MDLLTSRILDISRTFIKNLQLANFYQWLINLLGSLQLRLVDPTVLHSCSNTVTSLDLLGVRIGALSKPLKMFGKLANHSCKWLCFCCFHRIVRSMERRIARK